MKTNIYDYCRLMVSEANHVKLLLHDAHLSTSHMERARVHMKLFRRNYDCINDLLNNTSEVEDSYKFMNLVKEAPIIERMLESFLNGSSRVPYNVKSLNDEFIKFANLVPD